MATDLAPVTPSVLRWARESVGVSLDDAAKRAGVAPERVAAWESGDAEPTVAKLRSLAKLYQRPLAVFFLPEPPTQFSTLRDFRRPAEHGGGSWSRALHKVFRRAVDQQSTYVELLAGMGDEEPRSSVPRANVEEPREEVGQRLRAALGVPLSQQVSWRSPEEGLAAWIEATEALGVLVLRSSEVQPEEMRGFSIAGAPSVIVVNALDWPRGQIFTLLHEAAHLMLREGGLCDLLERESGDTGAIEAWCNAVAAAALMPRDAFLDDEVIAPSGERDWDEDVLDAFARRYSVSREAVLRRLVTLRRASWDLYMARRRRYMEIYAQERANERERRRQRQRSGGPPPHRMAIRDRGKPYVRTVLDAYESDMITASSASRLLSLKLQHFPRLEHEVRA